MARIIYCADCGKPFDLDKCGEYVYDVEGEFYCYPCALKLPKYIMKKCYQCFYFDFGEKGGGFCRYYEKKCEKSADACESYQGRFVGRPL